MLAAAQLYAHDIPDFAGPPGTDLLQVLWCPFDHGELGLPAVVLKWRRAADVTEVLDPQPERGYSMHVFTCPASFEHPHQLVME